MSIRFSRSATRHSIEYHRARYVVEHCACPLYSPDPDDADLVVFLGPDRDGIPLDVIHAMKLRPKYRADYERVMRCQGQ